MFSQLLCISIKNVYRDMKNKLIFLIISLFHLSCDDEIINNRMNRNKVVSGKLTQNAIWYSDTIYTLKGNVTISNGTVLTIQQGTLIKGSLGKIKSPWDISIEQGGKIIVGDSPELQLEF